MLLLKKPSIPSTVKHASGGSSPSDKGGGGTNLCRPLRPQAGLQVRGGVLGNLGPSPGSATACVEQSFLENGVVTVIYRVPAICRSTLWKI